RPEDDLRVEGDRVSASVHRVPWGRSVERVVAIVADRVVVVAPAQARQIDAVTNVAGEPRDTLHFDGVPATAVVTAPDGVSAERLHSRGALTRAALMSGALQTVAEMTARYTTERKQFGKPVGTFQAVQAHVVAAAEEAALVDIAVQVAGRESDRQAAGFEIAAAKALANNAARVATRAAHQAHGVKGSKEFWSPKIRRRLRFRLSRFVAGTYGKQSPWISVWKAATT